MKKNIKYIVLIIAGFLVLGKSFSQISDTANGASGRPSVRSGGAAVPKPYKDVVTAKAITTDGFFKVHRVEGRYLFEIPVKLFERDILVTARVSAAAAKTSPGTNRNTYMAGDPINENMLSFSKGVKNKVFLKVKYFVSRASDSTNGVAKALKNNSIQPLAASFDIKAYSNDSTAVVIDMTDFISADNDILFFHKAARKGAGGITTMEPDRSYIEGIKTFPINIEIKAVKTYKAGTDEWLTYGLNSSMVLLPETPMRPRYADTRLGYFKNSIVDFDASERGAEITSMLARWRLEPKPEDVEKYKRGELVEPQKPIIIYIDPATPKKWVPYLIAGVNDWQIAFEQAGFKNAIMAKEAPENDSTWSLENALYSAIVYKPSNIANASGPHVSDPRSGEIIETHINWYHNVMDLLYQWYFVQCANIDPRARKPEFDEKLMGQLIRFVSSHEVGHTLGLMHNFGSSNTVPVELLRNKAWVEANGHTPSIMDYARFNYVAQPEDNISEKGIFPRIGAYDKWAIEWGYSWFPDLNTPEDEVPVLAKLITDSLAANKYLIYGAQGTPDPRNQSEVLSDNPMKANAYGIKNLKGIVPHIKDWVKVPGKGYEKAKEVFTSTYSQYQRYLGHVTTFVVGKYVINDQPFRASLKNIELAKQKEALSFLNEHFFNTPHWLISNKEVFELYGYFPRLFSATQEKVVGDLLDNDLLYNLSDRALYGEKGYSVEEYLNELSNYILSEFKTGKPVTEIERRYLQRLFIEGLADKIKPGATTLVRFGGFASMVNANVNESGDATSVLKIYLSKLNASFKKAIAVTTNASTKSHYMDLQERLESALTASKTVSKWNKKK